MTINNNCVWPLSKVPITCQKKEKTDDFFCVQNRQNPFKFSYILSIDKKVCMCNVVVKGLFNSPLMHLH